MSAHTFAVPGPVVPKARARVARGHAYTPQATRDYEAKVRRAALAAGVSPLVGRIRLTITIHSADRRRRDLDNMIKAIQDALNGVAYVDDSQIDQLQADRMMMGEPGAWVTVEEIA